MDSFQISNSKFIWMNKMFQGYQYKCNVYDIETIYVGIEMNIYSTFSKIQLQIYYYYQCVKKMTSLGHMRIKWNVVFEMHLPLQQRLSDATTDSRYHCNALRVIYNQF